MEEDQEKMMSSLRSRRKKPSVGIICCFTGGGTHHHRRASFDMSSYNSHPPSPRCSPGWFKSKEAAPGKCRSFISRMGRHRRHASAEFNYDPLSYSLNFAEEDVEDEESHAMSFSARFSAMSSPRRTPRSPLYGSTAPTIMEDRGFESSTPTRNKSGLSSSPSPRRLPISSNPQILVQLC